MGYRLAKHILIGVVATAVALALMLFFGVMYIACCSDITIT